MLSNVINLGYAGISNIFNILPSGTASQQGRRHTTQHKVNHTRLSNMDRYDIHLKDAFNS